MLFEAGPWDNAEAVAGAHIFSKKRKLLYGSEHDDAAHNEDGSEYAPKELHKLHGIWRRSALKMMQEMCSRTKGEVRLEKKAQRGHPMGAWPGDLAKHHHLVEEMCELGVLSMHQDDHARMFAVVHRSKLNDAVDRFINAPAAAAASEVSDASVEVDASSNAVAYFTPSTTFIGQRKGSVFKKGEKGIGYYRDGPTQEQSNSVAAAPLPDGWVEGTSPEGYHYYYHLSSGTSSWERPTGQPPSKKSLPLSWDLGQSYLTDASALRKLRQDSGAQVCIANAVKQDAERDSALAYLKAQTPVDKPGPAASSALASLAAYADDDDYNEQE
ncbi:MAG: hypothetical protein SGPRY_000849 [Prymnesium sp.]